MCIGKYIEIQISDLLDEPKNELMRAFRQHKKTSLKQKTKIIEKREVQTVQRTLGGYSVSVIPKVRTTDGHFLEWDRNAIVNQLMKETKLGEKFLSKPAITEEEARQIAKETEKRIKDMGVKFLSGPLVRELVNIILLERGHTEWRNISTRVGTPVYDAYRIDMGTGFEANDNANLQENAETSHKKKADKMSKEQYLLMLPPKLADAHLNGDIHIHDLEYLGTRAFCLDASATIPMIMNGEFSFAKAGDFDPMFQRPAKIMDRELVDVSFLNIMFFGPRGCRRLLRVYRKKTDEKILNLRTNLGKTLRLSKDHPLIICENGNLLERRAGDTKVGDALATGTPLLFGTIPTKINMVRELYNKATAGEIDNVYARGLDRFFEKHKVLVSGHGQLQKQWKSRGILPVSRLAEMTTEWSDETCEEEFKGITLGVTGSEHVLPGIFEITPEMARLAGYFVSEGNYNVVQQQNYNIVITSGNHEVFEDIKRGIRQLNTYTTISSQPNGAQQIYFGGKLIYLLFRRVLGIPEGAANKRIPAKFFCMDKKISDEFLSAYLTGDGSFAYRKEKSDAIISFTTTSEELKTDLLYLLAANGITARAYRTSSRTKFPTGHKHTSNVWRVAFNGENVRRFLKFSTFIDEKRSRAAEDFLEKIKPKKAAFKEERVAEMQEIDTTTGYVYDFVLEGLENEEHVFMAGDGLLVHNCQDWDLRYFFYYGLMPDGSGTKASVAGPAKKAEVAILHAVKALGSAQTNFAGGQGFYNFLTFMAPYFEGMNYDEIEQLMQMFVYEMTQMMVARGGQLVFSSVQLSPGIPTLWRDKPVVYKGRIWDGNQAQLRTYGEFEREVRLSFEALMNVMLKGDYWGKPFNFPKPEISIEPDFMQEDEEFNRTHPEILSYNELYTKAFELAAKYGAPYFDNQLPEYRGAGKGISCYQCLAGDELVPIAEKDGKIQVMSIERLFRNASKNGISIDPNSVEFAEFNGRTSSTDFKTLRVSLETFKGVMRKKYSGRLLNIILNSGRRIRVTPDHPVFVLENGTFVKKKAGDLVAGQYVPVLKNLGFNMKPLKSINIEQMLIDAGYESEIVTQDEEVNIRNAKKRGLPRDITITSELIRFLGYYIAEGCKDHSGRRYSVRLSFGKHETGLIKDAVRCIRQIGFNPAISVEKTETNICINSKLLYLLLDALGCGHDAHSKSVPDILFNIEPSLVKEYVYCSFKGDGNALLQIGRQNGYLHKACNIRMKLVSKNAIQKLILLGQKIGIQMNYMVRDEKVKHPQSGDEYSLKSYSCYVTSQHQIQKFYEETGYGEYVAVRNSTEMGGTFTRIPISGTCLQYSDLKYPSQYRSGGYDCISQHLIIDNRTKEIIERFIKGDVHPLKIKRIEEEKYEGYVYDLVDVSNTHNFSNALGVITGNCCAYNFSSSHEKDSEFEQKLYFKEGKHFSMGAWQVVSINCPRAAYKAQKNDESLFKELKLLMDQSIELFKVKRKWMDVVIRNNRMPFATQRPKDPITMKRGETAVDLDALVYTIGVVGINEMVQHHTGKEIYESEDARRLAIRAMFELKFYAKELSEKYGMEIALARTPAETTAQRFAVSDLLHAEYRKCAEPIIKGNLPAALSRIHETRNLPIYYTNGTHVPPSADVALPQRIKLEETFFPIVDGGNILHIWLGEAAPDPHGLKEFALKLAKETQVGYFAFTRDMTVCMDDFHVASGLLKECPNCDSENVEHLSRVTGYIQAVSGWNEGKKQELKDRKRYGVGGV
jgi:anaerobic ribonucleoside-triphosphate reductase/intein/homing endonuclease